MRRVWRLVAFLLLRAASSCRRVEAQLDGGRGCAIWPAPSPFLPLPTLAPLPSLGSPCPPRPSALPPLPPQPPMSGCRGCPDRWQLPSLIPLPRIAENTESGLHKLIALGTKMCTRNYRRRKCKPVVVDRASKSSTANNRDDDRRGHTRQGQAAQSQRHAIRLADCAASLVSSAERRPLLLTTFKRQRRRRRHWQRWIAASLYTKLLAVKCRLQLEYRATSAATAATNRLVD